MKTKLTLLLSILLVTLATAQDKWKTLEKDNYIISYPKNWVSSDQKPQPTIEFVLLSEEASQKKDQFRENINLNTENLSGKKLSLKEYIKLALDQVKTQIPSAKTISKKNIELNGKEAKKIIWSADLGGGIVLKFKQLFLINNETAYILTYTASMAEYDIYDKVSDKIFNSFKFTK